MTEHPQATLTAVFDPSHEAASACAAVSGARVADSFDDLADPDVVDAVIIASPHAQHALQARRALELGISVLVEKPLALTAADAWAVLAAARDSVGLLLVGHTLEYTDSARQLTEAIHRGELGRLHAVFGTFTSWTRDLLAGAPVTDRPGGAPRRGTYSTPAAGGGQLHGQATHPLSMMLRTSGLVPASVQAITTTDGLDVDVADGVLIGFRGGAIGTLATSGGARDPEVQTQTISYHGSVATAVQDLATGTVQIVRHDGSPGPELRTSDPYPTRAPVHALVAACRGAKAQARESDWPGALAAARATAVVEAALASARDNRARIVTQPEDAELPTSTMTRWRG